MLKPSVSMARKHVGGLVAVGLAVFGGAAMVTANAVLGETALVSHLPADRLADTDIVVSAKQSYPVVEDFDIPLAERVTLPADLVETVGEVEGVEEASAYFDEESPVADREGEVDLITVSVEPGASVDGVADAVDDALPGEIEVTTGAAKGDVEALGGGSKGELLAMALSLSGTLLLLIGFIVAGALSVSVANQRRDLALLRAVGATPRQVRRLIAAQASAVAALALIPGVIAGYLLAEAFVGALVDAGLVSAALPLSRSPVAALAAAVLLLVTVQLAARGAAMRASRMSATEAVAESRVEPRAPSRVRTAIGLVLFALALGQSLVPLFTRSEAAFAASTTGTLTAIIGLALAGPALVRAVTGRAARRLSDRTRAPVWLAVSNSRAYALRTAGSVTVLALAVGFTLTQVYSQSTAERTAAAELEEGMTADATVTGDAADGITASDAADLEGRPGVEAAVPMASTTLLRTYEVAGDAETEPYAALAFGDGAERVVDLGVDDGDLADLEGETVALSSSAARAWGVDVGEEVALVLADGTEVRPTVVATYERGIGFGTIVASTDLLGGERLFDTVLVDGDAEAAAAWAADRPGLEAEPGAAALTAGSGVSPDRWITMLVTGAFLGYILLGVGNSLVASTVRRRGEFAALRTVGTTPRQIRAMVRREALILSAVAIGAGLAVSVPSMALLGLGFLGEPWPQGPLWAVPAVAAVAAAIAYAATALPARRALRASPAAVLAAD